MNYRAFTTALAPLSALALVACGSGGSDAGGEGSSSVTSSEGSETETIGTIEATIDGQTLNFVVPAERGVEIREQNGVKTLNITGMTDKGDGKTGMPYITLTNQSGIMSIQSVTVVDGSMMHQLESAGTGNGRITFETSEEGGPYSGSFSATLSRMDETNMPADTDVTFGSPVEISGTFTVE